ncbi:MAG: HAMP domain-containing histidine kinase [Bacteroidales bacterium]|nr:HAMP domain-containing histidine kinase [Bacteroidales bacterium]MCF8405222.1 HAMP domain-containing histidine kinase [Bacteroidales bacterium]
MKTNQGKVSIYNIAASHLAPDGSAPSKENYSIIVVSRDKKLHEALHGTLKHFALHGKGINIFRAQTLRDAKSIAEEYPEVVLVVIDNDIYVNGSFQVFVDFVKNELNNKDCLITFKDQLINMELNLSKEETSESDSEFQYAKGRLVEITRMIMLTTYMESSIDYTPDLEEEIEHTEYGVTIPDKKQTVTREMLYTVLAHDLKAPVGNIKVILDFLTNEPDLLDKDSSKDLLCRVRESANNIHEMLEDFLFWGRMIKQDIYFHPRRIDLDYIVRENIMLLKSTAGEKGISLQSSIQENTEIFADEYMMMTILRNLIYNAIKFTSPGGNIHISAEVRASTVKVSIADNGIGIPQNNIDKLFRTDAYLSTTGTARESGAGLGLILCKDFIEQNGGQISVKSDEALGSEFSFTVPKWNYGSFT